MDHNTQISLTTEIMNKQWLFSYGTLQDSEIQEILFGFACKKKNAKLPGWSLYASNEDGYLFIKPDSSGNVAGSIIEVDTSAIQAADQWEEIPFYRREKVSVILDDDTKHEAWAYTRRWEKGKLYAGTQLSTIDRETVLADAVSHKKQKERINLPFCDLYVMVPCSLSPESALQINQLHQNSIDDPFLQSFEEIARTEFSGYLAKELKRKFLAEIEILAFTYSNNGSKSEVGRQRIKTYITTHENTGLAVITFSVPACSVSPHDLLNQMTREDISVACSRESQKIMNMTEWIASLGLVQTGTPRSSVILSDEPTHADLCTLLAAEAKPLYDITSSEINAIARNDISQYKYYKMYVSETCEVELPVPFGDTYEDRVFDAILTLFIIELILFQDASLTRVQSQVATEIARSKYKNNHDALGIIEDLGRSFANAMLFWSVRNFRYRTAQNLADSFSIAFGIDRLRENYTANRALLEQLVQVHSARMAEKENRIITALLVVLTTLQVLPSLFIAFIAVLDGTVNKHHLYASVFSIGTCAIIWLVFLSRRNRKRIDEALKRLNFIRNK